MTNLLIGWTNRAKTGTLDASAAAARLGAYQAASDQGASSTAWQTPAATTSGWISIDAGSGVTWRMLGIFRTNLTSAATSRIRIGNDATFASNTIDTGVVSADVADGYGQHVHVLTAEITARYCRLDLDDAANPQGFLNVPLLFAGPAWQPTHNWSPDSTESAIAEATVPTTRGGQVWPELRWRRRRRLVSLPLVTRAERWPQLAAMELHAVTGGNVLVVPSADGDLGREPVFGQVEVDAVGYTAASPYQFRGTRFAVTERL